MNDELEVLKNYIDNFVKSYLINYRNGILSMNMYQVLMSNMERSIITTVLLHTKFNQTQAAKLLNMNRTTFRKKLDKLNIILDKESKI